MVMTDTNDGDKRREARVPSALPVDLSGATGTTRDVSASGIFFEVDATYTLGSTINFTVKLETPGGLVKLKCAGEIVRTEACGEKVGLAVKITESAIETDG
jgi:PilZ domain